MYGIGSHPSILPHRILKGRAGLILVLLLITGITIMPVSAVVMADGSTPPASSDLPARDNPGLISALKTHIAYVGQSQDDRMEGVIAYIDSISNGAGTSRLQEIHEDYLIIASSIPVMQTADDIGEARLGLQQQSRLFAEETKAQIVLFNGSTDTMREAIAVKVGTMEASITNMNDSLWLGKESARLTVFNRESGRREATLKHLNSKGVDVSRAVNISQQIDAQRSELRKALNDRSVPALTAVNSGLKPLNTEFRKTIEEYRRELSVEMKRTAAITLG